MLRSPCVHRDDNRYDMIAVGRLGVAGITS
jgi:hypothetical protein